MIRDVLIVEDVRQSREWLAGIVEAIFDQPRIMKEATLRDAEHACAKHTFDLALVDLSLPDGNGTTLLRRLVKEQPNCMNVVTTVMAADSSCQLWQQVRRDMCSRVIPQTSSSTNCVFC